MELMCEKKEILHQTAKELGAEIIFQQKSLDLMKTQVFSLIHLT